MEICKLSSIERRLRDRWNWAIQTGRISNRFAAERDDEMARWRCGDQIEFGLVLNGGHPTYFANNATTDSKIPLKRQSRVVSQNGFVCELSQFRLFKPNDTRISVGRQPPIPSDATSCRFFCQLPENDLSLLNRTPLLTTRLKHMDWSCYYNAFPLMPQGHHIWVPTVDVGRGEHLRSIPHILQHMSRKLLEDFLVLADNCGDLVLAFNSLHAGASVNHMHLQTLCKQRRLAIEDATTEAHGDFLLLRGYPSDGFCFEMANGDAIWHCISQLNELGIPINIVSVGGRLFVFPRNIDHEVVHEFPGDAIAGIDFSGLLYLADQETYGRIEAPAICEAFSKSVLSIDDLKRVGFY